MRPQILFPLFAALDKLPGLGPRLSKLAAKLCGEHVVDLLWHLPVSVIDRRASPSLASAENGAIVTLKVKVERHQKPSHQRQPYRVRCSDGSGFIDLVFFNARDQWLEKNLPIGTWRAISGRVERFGGELNMVHPDHIVPAEELESLQRLEPVYPLTAGLPAKTLRKAIDAALTRLPDLPEWIDPAVMRRDDWPSWREALSSLHRPEAADGFSLQSRARRRLAYDELLANQLALALVRQQNRSLAGRPSQGDGRLREKVLASLPYQLTGSQQQAMHEIAEDMAQANRMLRLLQGDVGSGKTVVALLAMLIAVEAEGQAALLAPTDILARQHFANLQPLAQAAGVEIALLTGRDKGKAREALLSRLAAGDIKLIVGTHALVQEDVVFDDLRLAVVDEQHRFGVQQRVALAGKGRGVDLLVMTATPIPRTLMLTGYGDIDVSRLTEKPPGRQPIDTRTLPIERLDDVVEGLRRAIAGGARIYWVCPLVDESEVIDLAAASERHRHLSQIFGDRVGLVHGKQKAAERDQTMAAFTAGDLDILVATTVIEVGVNVPEATVMVIEHAERFGLAQLHQLRGRVGRGSGKSSCLLLYQTPLGETAKARLSILRESEDGFRIAEEDLRLRGGGELLGTRQSGLPEFRLADLAAHDDLLTMARDDAHLIIERDHNLLSPRGEALRILLYLFQRDAMIKTLRSG
ncbi:ATP-dependent DNA helicase RecG [Dongia soli]|uniref:ATP-dependent DNA helicase RecG n=1 Tax=Dongia soli TaxID=600628 RepID=A0ABU5E9V3_9PROT|nr:ATP-dependent DNA helicase RecG [Dongia soli]MDY0883120.1 ATP-dependent DNA helicase RecG [Dongia soli]